MEATIEIPVRSTEVDYLGHVNNAKYLEYMEWGREGWYSQADCPFLFFHSSIPLPLTISPIFKILTGGLNPGLSFLYQSQVLTTSQ